MISEVQLILFSKKKEIRPIPKDNLCLYPLHTVFIIWLGISCDLFILEKSLHFFIIYESCDENSSLFSSLQNI